MEDEMGSPVISDVTVAVAALAVFMQMRVKPQPDIAFDAVENFRLRVVRGYKRYTTVHCHALHGFRFL